MADRHHILVVDDEESIRWSLQRFLRDAGFEVATASDVGEAKALVSEREFQAAVVDRILPDGQDGLEFVKFLRYSQPDCASILISAFPSFESAAEALRLETFAYLAKPFRKEQICQMVKEAVEHGASQKERRHCEALFRSLFDLSADATVVCDLFGNATFINPAFSKIFGFTIEEVLGRPVPFVPSWDKEESDMEMASLLAGMAVPERKTQRFTRGGSVVDVLISSSLCQYGRRTPKEIIFTMKLQGQGIAEET